MAFKFVKTETFNHRVDVVVPGEDPNKPLTGHFTATSRRHDKDKIRELTDPETAPGDAEFVRLTLVKLEGFEVDGVEPSNQDQLRDVLIADPALSACYIRDYLKAAMGVAEKNSARSSRR